MRLTISLLVGAFLFTAPAPLFSQSLLLPHDENYFGIELLKPDFDGDEVSFESFTLFATLRHLIHDDIAIVIEAPFSTYDARSFDSEIATGNLYAGLERRKPGRPYSWEFGIRFPTAPDNNGSARLVGVLSDVNRWEGFFNDLLVFVGGASVRYVNPPGFGFRGRIAQTLWIPTEIGDVDLFGLYSAHFFYLGEQVEFTGGLSGRILLTEDNLDIGERTFHQLDLAGVFRATQTWTGVHIRVPLDEGLVDIVNIVFGFQLGVAWE